MTQVAERVPTFGRTQREYYCQACTHMKPAAGGKHSGLSFICAQCRKALETMEEKK